MSLITRFFTFSTNSIQRTQQLSLLILTAVAITFVMSSVLTRFSVPTSFEVGQVATQTIRAPFETLIEDFEGTAAKRQKAATTVQPLLVFDDSIGVGTSEKLTEFFQAIAGFATSKARGGELLLLNTEARIGLEKQFRLDFVGGEWSVIGDRSLWPEIEEILVGTIEPIRVKGIVANRKAIEKLIQDNGASLLRTSTNVESRIGADSSFYGLAEAAKELEESIGIRISGRERGFKQAVVKLSSWLLVPNITYDDGETSKRKLKAQQGIDPIYHRLQRGEVIVREGELVTSVQREKLKRLQTSLSARHSWKSLFANCSMACFLLLIVYAFCLKAWRTFVPSTRDLAVLSLVLVGTFILMQIYMLLGESLSIYLPSINGQSFVLAAPVAAGGILLQMIFGLPGAFLFISTSALLAVIFFGGAWELPMLIALGNTVGALSVESCHKRTTFIKAGTYVAGVNAFVVSSYMLSTGDFGIAELSYALICAIIGGLTSGILGSSLAPLAEYFGSYVTDVKLLELSSLDHPLLRDLSVQAPGTWNHSMVMGQMAEAAAEGIGANALLARVGAYYHDIGKCKKPAYFVENQTTKENRHDKLTPSMSALIIKTHVKDGIDMAKKRRLPQAVLDFIPQHHGTALIEYFFDKAKKEAEEGEVVDETHYRYPGPKPQTREAGILMLADGIEAAARTLSDPSPAKIQGLVQKMINKIFASGELDECELTLKDLHLIAKRFCRVLTGIHHRRVEYSEPAEKRAKSSEDTTETLIDNSLKAKLEREKKDARRLEREKADGGKVKNGSSEQKAANGNGETLKRLGMS